MLDIFAIFIGALDSLPNFGRTMLSAAGFAALLCYTATRLPPDHVAVGVAYRKATLLALLTVPVLVYFVLDDRLVLLDSMRGANRKPATSTISSHTIFNKECGVSSWSNQP